VLFGAAFGETARSWPRSPKIDPLICALRRWHRTPLSLNTIAKLARERPSIDTDNQGFLEAQLNRLDFF
jgi:hypothetical protein